MDKEHIKARLQKIKALADRGVGGERDSALEIYNKLLSKYNIEDCEIHDEVTRQWFRWYTPLDKKLLAQIFYMVTGDVSYWEKTDKRRKMIGVDCTAFEFDEILFYYKFYRKHLDDELGIFLSAFFSVNELYPTSSARCYEETQKKLNERDELDIDLERMHKIYAMSAGIDKKRPNLQIEDKDNKGNKDG